MKDFDVKDTGEEFLENFIDQLEILFLELSEEAIERLKVCLKLKTIENDSKQN